MPREKQPPKTTHKNKSKLKNKAKTKLSKQSTKTKKTKPVKQISTPDEQVNGTIINTDNKNVMNVNKHSEKPENDKQHQEINKEHRTKEKKLTSQNYKFKNDLFFDQIPENNDEKSSASKNEYNKDMYFKYAKEDDYDPFASHIHDDNDDHLYEDERNMLADIFKNHRYNRNRKTLSNYVLKDDNTGKNSELSYGNHTYFRYAKKDVYTQNNDSSHDSNSYNSDRPFFLNENNQPTKMEENTYLRKALYRDSVENDDEININENITNEFATKNIKNAKILDDTDNLQKNEITTVKHLENENSSMTSENELSYNSNIKSQENNKEALIIPKIPSINNSDHEMKEFLHNQFVRRSKYWLFQASNLYINFDKIKVDYAYWQLNYSYYGIVCFRNRQKFSAVKSVMGKEVKFMWLEDIKNDGMKYLLQTSTNMKWEYGTRLKNMKIFDIDNVLPYNKDDWKPKIGRPKLGRKPKKKAAKVEVESDGSQSIYDWDDFKQKTNRKCDSVSKKKKYLQELMTLSRLVLSGLNFVDIYLIEPVIARRHKYYVFELIRHEQRKKENAIE